jgi:hypothetical protein
MTTISIVRVRQRLAEVESALKTLEEERADLLAALRTIERLSGPLPEDAAEAMESDGEKAARMKSGQNVAKTTFPQVVLSILKNGPIHRDDLIKEILKRIPHISPTVLASSIARMAFQEKILKDHSGIYRLPDSGQNGLISIPR